MRIRILAATFVLVGGAASLLFLPGCEPALGRSESLEPQLHLTVLTPHDQSITNAFSHGFARWYQQKEGKRVGVRVIKRGTLECLQYLDDLERRSNVSKRDVPDVMFGGGINDHNYLRDHKHSRKVDLRTDLAEIPAEIAGLPTRDGEGYWFGTGLSSFGIYYNAAACESRGIAPPQTWTDLADARFAGWIGLASPVRSGSTREALQIILQRHGYTEGWSVITRLAANARALSRSSADVLDGVEDGVFLAGVAVNFEALRRANRSEGQTVYVNPRGASAVSPDVISVLNSAEDEALATAFVRYVLSPEGQMLWAGNASVNPIGEDPLYHYAIRPSVYSEPAEKLAMKENPVQADFGVKFDLALADRNANSLLPLFTALVDGQHIPLQKAWRAHTLAGTAAENHWTNFVAPPFDEAKSATIADQYRKGDAEAKKTLRSQWSAGYAERLKQPASSDGERG